jgi:hypothetical protein
MGSTISTAHRVQFCRALQLPRSDAKMGVRMGVGSLRSLRSLGIWREKTNFSKFSKFSVLRQPHSKAVVLGFGRTIVDGRAKGIPNTQHLE